MRSKRLGIAVRLAVTLNSVLYITSRSLFEIPYEIVMLVSHEE